jgi:hypothetical protein
MAPGGAAAAARVDFDRDVLPIFARSCVKCHGPQKSKAGLRLDSAAGLRKGGLGDPLTIPGQSDQSYIVHRMRGLGDEEVMPPEGPRVTSAELDTIRLWIDQGAVLPVEAPVAFVPAPTGVRRLTIGQYRNSITDMLGLAVKGPLEEGPDGSTFASVASFRTTMSERGVDLFREAALRLARAAFADPETRRRIVGCVPRAPHDACTRGFLNRWATRLWRQTPRREDLAPYLRLAARAGPGDARGLEVALAALLQSPRFLYAVEAGEPAPGQPGLRRYTGIELANRLALFLWSSVPDDDLLDLAARGSLSTEEGVRTVALRMLADPRARRGVRDLVGQLLGLDELPGLARDRSLYPGDTPALRHGMGLAVERLVEHLVFERRADILELFDTRETFVNADLARLHGLAGTFPGDALVKVTLPADSKRVGLLGTPAFLALTSFATRPSPTLRGVFIREKLLCQDVPPPPDDVATIFAKESEASKAATMREKLEAHLLNPSCASCHRFFDPMGLALETFDGLGAERTHDQGLALKTDGELNGRPFKNARELGAIIRGDPLAAACLVRNAYSFAVGHSVIKSEEPEVARLVVAFHESGRDLQNLLVDIASGDGFRFAVNPAPANDSKRILVGKFARK